MALIMCEGESLRQHCCCTTGMGGGCCRGWRRHRRGCCWSRSWSRGWRRHRLKCSSAAIARHAGFNVPGQWQWQWREVAVQGREVNPSWWRPAFVSGVAIARVAKPRPAYDCCGNEANVERCQPTLRIRLSMLMGLHGEHAKAMESHCK